MDRVVYTNLNQREVSGVIRSLIRGRYLLLELILKDLRARYRHTIMGILWAVLQPLLMMLILTFVFRSFEGSLRPGAEGLAVPFALFLLAALVPWQFTTTSLTRAAQCFIENQELVKKVFFPRETIPLAAIGQAFVNGVIGLAVFFVIYFAMGQSLSWTFLWVPFIFAIHGAFVVGCAFLLSALNVIYRDIAYMLDVGLMLGFYASPVFYSPEVVLREGTHPLFAVAYQANPMVGLIGAYRDALIYHQPPVLSQLIWPMLVSGFVILAGVAVFRRTAPVFSDFV
ncbi:MAG: hypothetical protein AMXMBFR84_41140 [Candidatus Hydrogenedentota bacterium]